MAKLELTLTDTQLRDVLKLLAGIQPKPTFIPWESSPKRIAKLLAEHPEGLTGKDICQHLNISYQAAHISLRRLTERGQALKQLDNTWTLTQQTKQPTQQ